MKTPFRLMLVAIVAALVIGTGADGPLAGGTTPDSTSFDDRGCAGAQTVSLTSGTDTTINFGCVVSDVAIYTHGTTATWRCTLYGDPRYTVSTNNTLTYTNPRSGAGRVAAIEFFVPAGLQVKRSGDIKDGFGYKACRIRWISGTDSATVIWDTRKRG